MPYSKGRPLDTPDNHTAFIGKYLQALRKKRGLTQKGLAEKIGLTREAIASYESCRSHLTDSTLIDLAAALRVSTDEILGLKNSAGDTPVISRRWVKRIVIVESLPESIKKHILRTLDDLIKANTRLSIFDDKP
jgi:transcriptional regulator with XRE-family HTH domain